MGKTLQVAFSTKTGWTGLSAVGFGIYQMIQGDVPNGMNAFMMGLGAIFMREGVAKAGE